MTLSSQCLFCKHYELGGTCAAFPRGIPEPILLGEVDHRKPYPGDGGIQYEPVEPGKDPDDGN